MAFDSQGDQRQKEAKIMKTIGLIGGMGWPSTVEYYRILNETVQARLGGLHSAEIVLVSVDFEPIEQMQREGRWADAGQRLAQAARQVEQGGADLVLLCTNTMHKVSAEIEAALSVPFLHIADATAAAIQAQGIERVGLLGTAYTMEQAFYKGRLESAFGLEVLVPDSAEREHINRIIFDELVRDIVKAESKAVYVQAIEQLVARGAQAIILGCTEIMLLVDQADASVPLFDTTRIHAVSAVVLALEMADEDLNPARS